MPKARKKVGGRATKLEPLDAQLRADEARQFARQRHGPSKAERRGRTSSDADEGGAMSSDVSRRVLAFAREQLEEEKMERLKAERQTKTTALDDSDIEDLAGADEGEEEYEIEYLNEDQFAELQVSADDERAIEAFMDKNKPERRTLADIIMEKIREKEDAAARRAARAENGEAESVAPSQPRINPQVVEVYQSVGTLLRRYRAGKIPKAFKIIPALRNWEEVLYYTHPESWSPQAMRAATRLFASNLNRKMAQRFYALVLLPAVRDDIAENKKLNYHLYMALKKALYRPDSFFKGLLLPLCEEGDCTLREATIIGSVLAKVSIPMMHSAAAMLKMASMSYNGATSLFLRVLLNKKYSLPYKVIDSILRHFVAFRNDDRRLPVLWHQSLLVFAQRYKNTLTTEQKDLLKPLLKQHFHYQITPEIRRELFFATASARNV